MKRRIKNHDDWLALRKKVVTATEAASILGLNPYMSANKMWDQKFNSTFQGNAYTFIGNLLEPIVVEVTNYALGSHFELIETGDGKVFYIDMKLKLGATPDATDGVRFLECKTTKPQNYEKYQHSPPLSYIVQLIVQMMCGKMEEGFLAILSTDLSQYSQDLELPLAIFRIHKCPRLCELLESELKRFWKTVEDGETFRVNSKVKQQAVLLARLAQEKII